MGIGPTTYNLATLPLPDWAKGKTFNEYLEVDVDGDNQPDFMVMITNNNSITNTLSQSNVIVKSLNTKFDPQNLAVKFNAGTHHISTNIFWVMPSRRG